LRHIDASSYTFFATSLHAGVPPEPVTGSGRLDADALDAAILGYLPRYFDDGSPIPVITISPPGA
jgi:hypothetical protein